MHDVLYRNALQGCGPDRRSLRRTRRGSKHLVASRHARALYYTRILYVRGERCTRLALMTVATAALTGHRRRHQQGLARRKRQIEAQKLADYEAAARVIRTIDADGAGVLTPEQIRELVCEVTGQQIIDDDGLNLVIASARKEACVPGSEVLVEIPCEAVLRALSKYRLYLQRRPEIDALFDRWDIDKDHKLAPNELK